MGWISKRHMLRGGSIGGKFASRVYPKEGAPLRRITIVLVHSTSIFQADRVRLECGHDADAWGSVKARCPQCKTGS